MGPPRTPRTRLLQQSHSAPGTFVREALTWPAGEGPAAYQQDLLDALPSHRRVAARGPHGLGKTALAAWIVLWFALTREAAGQDWKIVTTASAWRQLTRYLWPEIRKWARRLRWSGLGRPAFDARNELLALSLKLGHGEAFAAASDTPAAIEGAHADALLYIFDEAKTIPPTIWDAAEGALAGPGETYALAISTPGEPAGRFYEIHARRPGLEDWWTRHVTLAETLEAGRVSPAWAEQRRRQWGETSAVYQNRVLGEFAASDEAGVVPLAWVEAANERWLAWQAAGSLIPRLDAIGVDVARSGADQTVLAGRTGRVVTELRRSRLEDTMVTTGRVAAWLRPNPWAMAIVDVIGIGAGVVDRLREQRLPVLAFNAAERSLAVDRSLELGFVNRRSEAWWGLREQLDPAYDAELAVPPDDELTGDLTAPRWTTRSEGRIEIESKDQIRARLGRSTDAGDAVVQACWRGHVEGGLLAKAVVGAPRASVEREWPGTGAER